MIPALTFMSGAAFMAFILMQGDWRFFAGVISCAAAVGGIVMQANGIS